MREKVIQISQIEHNIKLLLVLTDSGRVFTIPLLDNINGHYGILGEWEFINDNKLNELIQEKLI